MTPQELRDRTSAFAKAVVTEVKSFGRDPRLDFVTSQLVRSATSTAANYRAACVARSHADFRSKIGIALEEADESTYWLEFLSDTERPDNARLLDLISEATALTGILGASRRTSMRRAHIPPRHNGPRHRRGITTRE